MKALIGRKIGMTRTFLDDGTVVPTTVIQAGPCTVVQRKTTATDGYEAVQITYGTQKHPTKPMQGHYAKAQVAPGRVLREVRISPQEDLTPGTVLTVERFRPGDVVKVTGSSKGRGFAGGTKKWGFSGGDQTHGCKSHRTPGSMGSNSKPGRTFKGRRMPGRMGNTRVTVRNLKVVAVDTDRHLIFVKGAVPGARNSYVMILGVS